MDGSAFDQQYKDEARSVAKGQTLGARPVDVSGARVLKGSEEGNTEASRQVFLLPAGRSEQECACGCLGIYWPRCGRSILVGTNSDFSV